MKWQKEKTSSIQEKLCFRGVESCQSICNLGKIYNVELPLCNSINEIIKGTEADCIISTCFQGLCNSKTNGLFNYLYR